MLIKKSIKRSNSEAKIIGKISYHNFSCTKSSMQMPIYYINR